MPIATGKTGRYHQETLLGTEAKWRYLDHDVKCRRTWHLPTCAGFTTTSGWSAMFSPQQVTSNIKLEESHRTCWGINSISCHGRLPPLIPEQNNIKLIRREWKVTKKSTDLENCVEGKNHDKQWATWRSKRSNLKKLNRRRANLGQTQWFSQRTEMPPLSLHAPHLQTGGKNILFCLAKQLPESRSSSMFHSQSPPLYYQLLQGWCRHWQRHPWIRVRRCVPLEILPCEKNVTCAEQHPPWASQSIVSNVLVSPGLEPRHFAGSPSSFHIAPGCGKTHTDTDFSEASHNHTTFINREFLSRK